MAPEQPMIEMGGNSMDPNGGCAIDGVSWDCNDLARRAGDGTIEGAVTRRDGSLHVFGLTNRFYHNGGSSFTIFVPGSNDAPAPAGVTPRDGETFGTRDTWETLDFGFGNGARPPRVYGKRASGASIEADPRNQFCWSINDVLKYINGYLKDAWERTTQSGNGVARSGVEHGGLLALTKGGQFEAYNYPPGEGTGRNATISSGPTQKLIRSYAWIDSLVIAWHTHPNGSMVPSGVAGSAAIAGDYAVANSLLPPEMGAGYQAPPFGVIKFGPRDTDVTVYARNGMIHPRDYNKTVGCWVPGEGD